MAAQPFITDWATLKWPSECDRSKHNLGIMVVPKARDRDSVMIVAVAMYQCLLIQPELT